MPTLLLAHRKSALDPNVISQIKTSCPDYKLLITKDAEEMKAHLDDIEIIVGNIPVALVKNMPKLRWLQQWGAGADWLQKHPEAKEKDFILTNASGVHPVQITEHVFAFLLSFARQLPQSYEAQKQNTWQKFSHADVFELEGQTMLIVGVGAIGERIAKVATAFGMKVVGVKRHLSQAIEGVNTLISPDDLDEALPAADVVVLTVPLTPETSNLMGKKELELMKEDACLINIGRGGTIDESALLEVLKQGKLRGVGLDVFEQEPLAPESGLWNADRVLITPHYSGLSPRYDERAFAIFFENLKRYKAGEPLINVVNKDLGY